MVKVRLFLLDEEVQDPLSALLKAEDFEVTKLETDTFTEAWFCYNERGTPPPNWAAALAEIVGGVHVSGGTSHRAIVFIQSQERWFALTFGYGYRSLDSAMCEDNFGFRVAMNCLNEDHIKSIGSHVLGHHSMKMDRTFSADGRLDDFGLGYYDEFIRRVNAKPIDTEFGARVDGADSLEIQRTHLPEDWDAFFASVMKYFESNLIHERYNLFSRFTLVSDARTKNFLEEQLASDILAGVELELWPQFERNVPEDLAGYRFITDQGEEQITEDFPTIQQYRALYESRRAQINPTRLKRDRIQAISEADEILGSWPIRTCIDYSYESQSQEQAARTYFLEGGRWIQAKHGYLNELNEALKSVYCAEFDLPAAAQGAPEPEYNKALARARDWALLDGDLVYPPGETAIEICDLYNGDKQLIHVKRLKGSSFTSYVLQQVGNSCKLLGRLPDFSEEFARKLRDQSRDDWADEVDNPFNVRTHKPVIALMAKPGTRFPEDLPLMLKLSIERLVKEVRDDYGFIEPCITLVDRPE